MKYFCTLLLFTIVVSVSAQSQSHIYFFRDAKFVGAIVGYNVYMDSALVGRVSSGSVITYSCEPGLRTFRAKTEGEGSITIDLKPGVTYYIECGTTLGAVVGHPSFRQVSASEAKVAVGKINPQLVAVFDVDPEFVTDTTRALNNMFQRKRKGGVKRGIWFGAIAVVALINTIKQTGSTSTVYGVSVDTGPDPANYVVMGVCTVVAITGAAQASKYNDGRLTQVIRDYKEGRDIPKEFKSKLKKKDFK
jgi:hypothetical protein